LKLHTHIPVVIAQQGSAPPPNAVEIPLGVIVLGGVGLFIALMKWLLGREISRLDEGFKNFDQRLQKLESLQASQQVEAATIARLEKELLILDRQINQLATDMAALSKVGTAQDRIVEALGELRERVQRADNIGSALFQAQDLIKDVQKELLQFKSHVAAGFVTEEKFVRDMTVLSSRVDAVWERFDQVAGSRPRLLEGGEGGYR